MRWEKKADRIYGAAADVPCGRRVYHLGFRIDGREGPYRVDAWKPLIPVWEAIDGGVGFSSVKEAKAFVTSWRRLATEQGELSPRTGRNGAAKKEAA